MVYRTTPFSVTLNDRTAINFVHVSGRSLYIVKWRMVVVEGGNVLHLVNGRGNCPGGENVRRGICPGGYVQSGNVRIPVT